MGKPITEKEMKDFIENNKYRYLKTETRKDSDHTRKYILIQCDKGHEAYWTRWNTFKSGHRCPHCKNENYKGKWNRDEIIRFVNNEEGYEFIEFIKFDKVKSRIKIKCPKSHTYEVTFSKFKEGRRCPVCKESKGEKVIEKILKEFNIGYARQHRFDDCRFKYRLPFDFYLTDYNICIEFDGRQHFEIVGTFGGFDSFIDTIIRDTVKNEYCKKNNIRLIRIPYWDMENIEKIIVNELELE